MKDGFRIDKEQSYEIPPPLSLFALLITPPLNVMNIEFKDGNLNIYNAAPHHSGVWFLLSK